MTADAMKKLLLALFSGSLLLVSAAFANTQYTKISHDELKQAVAQKAAFVIDVNGSASYKNGHIPGAIDFTANKDSLAALLPKDKDALIVAYCGNEKCGAYKRAADVAASLGYTNVRHYSPGLQGWKDAGEKLNKKKS